MTNWLEKLEGEEKERANLSDSKILLHVALERFYDICKRVNKLKFELILNESEVIGVIFKILKKGEFIGGGEFMPNIIFKRGIRFNVFDRNKMTLEIITIKYRLLKFTF